MEARPTPRPELIPHDPVVRIFFRQKEQSDAGERSRSNLLFPLPELGPDRDQVFRRWFGSAKHLKGVYDVFFGVLRTRPPFMDTRFFHLAQCLEAFHRRAIQRDEKYVPREQWRPILARVKALIPEGLPNGLTDGMRKALEWVNDFSFPERLRALFGSLHPDSVAAITNDAERFVLAIRDTRNLLTHLAPRKDSKAFPSDRWIDACESMELLLLILMLKHCGVPEDRIRERLEKAHRDTKPYVFPTAPSGDKLGRPGNQPV